MSTEALALVVAGYAALVSTVVGIHTILRARTRMTATPRRMQMVRAGEAAQEAITITLTNHSGHPVNVTHLSFGRRKGGKRWLIARPFPVEEPVPIRVEPHDNKVVWVYPSTFEGALDLDGKVEVTIATSDSKTFSSGRVYLEPWTHWDWRRPWRRPRRLDEGES